MRAKFVHLVAVMLCGGLSGCGSNLAKAEAVALQMIEGMHKIADGLEVGDKVAIKAGMAQFGEAIRESKSLKTSASQNREIEKKYKIRLDVAEKRMMEAITMARKAGKLKPAELKELADEMQALGDSK